MDSRTRCVWKAPQPPQCPSGVSSFSTAKARLAHTKPHVYSKGGVYGRSRVHGQHRWIAILCHRYRGDGRRSSPTASLLSSLLSAAHTLPMCMSLLWAQANLRATAAGRAGSRSLTAMAWGELALGLAAGLMGRRPGALLSVLAVTDAAAAHSTVSTATLSPIRIRSTAPTGVWPLTVSLFPVTSRGTGESFRAHRSGDTRAASYGRLTEPPCFRHAQATTMSCATGPTRRRRSLVALSPRFASTVAMLRRPAGPMASCGAKRVPLPTAAQRCCVG